MSIFEEMYPYWQFDSWGDFDGVKRMLAEGISRGFVEEVPVVKTREVPRTENWYRDKDTGDIYALIPPEPPARGGWERVDICSHDHHRVHLASGNLADSNSLNPISQTLGSSFPKFQEFPPKRVTRVSQPTPKALLFTFDFAPSLTGLNAR